MKVVTSADFEAEVLKSNTPVLVDFYADWCGPCKQISPTLEQLAQEKAGTLKIVKVNVDASQDLASQFSVRSIPNLVMIRNGDVIAQKVGGASKADLTKWIEASLALPAGTKLDLAPKAVKLSDQDKQKLRDAFAAAVNNSPNPDTPIQAPNGAHTTIRKAVQQDLDSGVVFKQVEAILTAGVATLDQIVGNIKNTKFGTPPKGPGA